MKGEMKSNSKHLFELATPEIASNVFLILPKYNSMQIQ